MFVFKHRFNIVTDYGTMCLPDAVVIFKQDLVCCSAEVASLKFCCSADNGKLDVVDHAVFFNRNDVCLRCWPSLLVSFPTRIRSE